MTRFAFIIVALAASSACMPIDECVDICQDSCPVGPEEGSCVAQCYQEICKEEHAIPPDAQ